MKSSSKFKKSVTILISVILLSCIIGLSLNYAEKSGESDEVLPPWTPVKTVGNKGIEIWGRKYVFGSDPFPVSVETAGASILSSPIRLRAVVEGKEVEWKNNKAGFDGIKKSAASFKSVGASNDLTMDGKAVVEYDGLIKVDIMISPKKEAVALDSLILEIPIKNENALYYHYSETSGWGNSNSGSIPPDGWRSNVFKPFVWIGDNDRGFCWFSEDAGNWFVRKGANFIEIKRDSKAVALRLMLVNTPVKLKKALRYTFGFQATPVKPLPQDWRKWYYGITAKAGSGMPPDIHLPPEIRMILWWWMHFKKWFYPEAINEKELKEIVDTYHKRGHQVIVYITPAEIRLPSEEFKKHEKEWRTIPALDKEFEGQKVTWARVCPKNGGWRDYWLSVVNYQIEQYGIDGLYIDNPYPWPCKNTEHRDGYKDELTGELHVSYPIFETREMLKRANELFYHKKKKFSLLVHMSANMMIPIYSFAQGYIDGEQYHFLRTARPYAGLPLDKFRAEFMGRQWGLIPFFTLRTIDKEGKPASQDNEGTMLALLHDVVPTYNGKVYMAKNDFGMDNVEWHPYWENTSVQASPKNVLISYYKKTDKKEMLLIAGNTDYEDGKATIVFNWPALGFKKFSNKKIRATDLLSKEEFQIDKDRMSLDVKKRDFRLLRIWGFE